MSGKELKQLAESLGLNPVSVCHEANISDSTLYKIYNDEKVRDTTKAKVVQAIKRLAAKSRDQLTAC